jgi:hypothetical protein
MQRDGVEKLKTLQFQFKMRNNEWRKLSRSLSLSIYDAESVRLFLLIAFPE